MDPDLPLLQALQEGDDSALTELMNRHRDALYYFAFRYIRNEALARDIVQETFVRVYFNAAKLKPTNSVKTWLYTVALNLCRDQIRRKATRREAYSLDAPTPEGQSGSSAVEDTSSVPNAQAERGDRYALLQHAIDRLPAKLRDALILFSLEGKSQKEAADILGTSSKTLELRVYRAKQKLKALLGTWL